ncbi:MAG: hypothetical protein ACT4O1_14545 [Gemmatimonadota bacterium]
MNEIPIASSVLAFAWAYQILVLVLIVTAVVLMWRVTRALERMAASLERGGRAADGNAGVTT